MRFILLTIFITISFSASAQWWRIDMKFKKQSPRPSLIEQLINHSISSMPAAAINYLKIYPVQFKPSDYSYEAAEDVVMKAAQHNMRFRIYAEASYNFSELARLYILQDRLSEAKWFLLQSNIISRQQNDDSHTVSNLINLAAIKTNIGDYQLAEQDLTEAYDIACAKGFNDSLTEIEKKIRYLQQNKLPPSKPDVGYAETSQNNTKAE